MRKRFLNRGFAVAGAGLLLAACATDESINREASVQLEPAAAPPPTLDVGYESHGFNKGKPQVTKVTAVKDGLITREVVEGILQGCSWTVGIGEDSFAPAVAWENCRRGSTGTQQITKTGNIWPLKVGNTESYKITGSDQKYDWTTTRSCKVNAAVLVALEGKEIPTYEVVCRDNWKTRTWYYSPELQQAVKFKGWHKDRGLEDDWVAKLQ